MASSIYFEQEILEYESPKIDVIKLTARDVVCLSEPDNEGGAGYDDNWGI